MSLSEYKKKRKFDKTPEPKTKILKTKKDIYTIQKHTASHLHWDLRLELNGVLKSWAIPKQPPKQKGLKRLAIETEDHPIGYEKFEGIIPEGNYGAGKVEIWDKGTFELLEKNKDLIVVKIKGKVLEGEYCLVRTKFQGKKNNWIFFKR
ncbi:3'-phosphoesterase [archaeon]|jgi:DNA ligase D-like protein (predicted 3'-phosphoesterase)|nr:3'-phosphoesterase [archaeon]